MFLKTSRVIFPILFFCIHVTFSQNYEIEMLHPSMDIEIGKPAYISPRSNSPTFTITSFINAKIKGELIFMENNSLVSALNEILMNNGEVTTLSFNEMVELVGRYKVNFVIERDEPGGEHYYETYYFTVIEKGKIPRWNSLVVHPDENGKLRYVSDYRGNQIPDFSTAGYKGGGIKFPDVPVRITLNPYDGDDTERIQDAIDIVSSLDPDENGVRGKILLTKGIYEINSSLNITTGGVVISGEGAGDIRNIWLNPSLNYSLSSFRNSLEEINYTLIIATGSTRRTIINIVGEEGFFKIESSESEIVDQYVPVGAKSFRIKNPHLFDVGDKVIVRRNGNEDWIKAIRMDSIPPSPVKGRMPPVPWEPFNLDFENTITNIDGNIITLTAPIFNAIETKWGGGSIFKYDDRRITNVGVENLRAISFWMPELYGIDGTNHADRFLQFDNISDGWVENVAMEHFFISGGAINIGRTSKQITISNSSNLIAEPKFYSGPGYRSDRIHAVTDVEVGRYGFYCEGQANLVVGCYTINNRRSFGVSSRVPGPNVFLDCKAENNLTTSEPHHRWSVGGLYDNVHDDIAFVNRLYLGTGHGWSGANYVAWNTVGGLNLHQPPTAQNWSIGHKGIQLDEIFTDFKFKSGYWDKTGAYVLPRSLYIQQLKDRKGENFEALSYFHSNGSNENFEKVKVWNYPNPADYFTIFVYELQSKSPVFLSIYSLSGSSVVKRNFGIQNAGLHQFIWETTDDIGRPLNEGVYIYKFTINNQVLSNKLIIKK